MKMLLEAEHDELVRLAELGRKLDAQFNTPILIDFLLGVRHEAIHQINRWGEASDRAKRPADWFWLVGYLAGKALHAIVSGDKDKALHHCISTAAAMYNWHAAILADRDDMSPRSSDVATIVENAFPNETTQP